MEPLTFSDGTQGDFIASHGTAVASLRNSPRHHDRLNKATARMKIQLASVSEKAAKVISDVHPDKAQAQVAKEVDDGIAPQFRETLDALIAADAENMEYDTKRGVPLVTDDELEREHRDRFAALSEVDQIEAAQTGDIALRSAIFRDGAPKVWKFDSVMAERIQADMRLAAHRVFITRNYPAMAKPSLDALIPKGPDHTAINVLLEQAEQQRSERIDDVVAVETFLRGIVAVAAAATDRDVKMVFDLWIGNNNG